MNPTTQAKRLEEDCPSLDLIHVGTHDELIRRMKEMLPLSQNQRSDRAVNARKDDSEPDCSDFEMPEIAGDAVARLTGQKKMTTIISQEAQKKKQEMKRKARTMAERGASNEIVAKHRSTDQGYIPSNEQSLQISITTASGAKRPLACDERAEDLDESRGAAVLKNAPKKPKVGADDLVGPSTDPATFVDDLANAVLETSREEDNQFQPWNESPANLDIVYLRMPWMSRKLKKQINPEIYENAERNGERIPLPKGVPMTKGRPVRVSGPDAKMFPGAKYTKPKEKFRAHQGNVIPEMFYNETFSSAALASPVFGDIKDWQGVLEEHADQVGI